MQPVKGARPIATPVFATDADWSFLPTVTFGLFSAAGKIERWLLLLGITYFVQEGPARPLWSAVRARGPQFR